MNLTGPIVFVGWEIFCNYRYITFCRTRKLFYTNLIHSLHSIWKNIVLYYFCFVTHQIIVKFEKCYIALTNSKCLISINSETDVIVSNDPCVMSGEYRSMISHGLTKMYLNLLKQRYNLLDFFKFDHVFVPGWRT